MKVQLIFVEDSDIFSHNFPEKPVPSFLFILANYITMQLPDIKVEIYDGNHIDLFNNIDIFDGNIIGFSDWFSNHEESLRLMKQIKENNSSATIVFGGPNTSNLGKLLLQNYKDIDYLIVGDGEDALLQLVKGSPPETIPNLIYRQKGIITQNRNIFTDLNVCNRLAIRDYLPKKSEYIDDKSLLPVSYVRGCRKACKEGKCLYCSLPFNSMLRTMKPKLAWEQMISLSKEYGIEYFFETSDNFIISEKFLEYFLSYKPAEISGHFKIRIITDILSLVSLKEYRVLKKIGITSIFIGIDSINKKIQYDNRGMIYSKDNIFCIFDRLRDEDIKVSPTFIFGLVGESSTSMKENKELIFELLSKYNNIEDMLVDYILPLAGSPIFKMLSNNRKALDQYYIETKKNLKYDDSIDYHVLTKIYLRHYTKVDELMISETIKEIQRGFKIKNLAKFGGLRWEI